MEDSFARKIDYLRISVTDRCNERCVYCMPPEGVPSVPHASILTFDEILRLVRIAAGLGFTKFKLTGGEPLVRRGLPSLVGEMKRIPGVGQVTLTTNGSLLSGQMKELADAGLDAVNVSLDTADPELYRNITRGGRLQDVLDGLDAALSFPGIVCKIDCVLLGMKEQKLTDIAAFAENRPVHVRFIEMMPIGLGKKMLFHDCGDAFLPGNESDALAAEGHFVSCRTAAEILEKEFGSLEKVDITLGNGPAEYYALPGFCGKIGFIGAISHKFCGTCNRVRLTSQGFLKTCLQYSEGADLRSLLRGGADDREIEEVLRKTVFSKPREHSFLERSIEQEERGTMSGIGG
jgi:cyclic pyranopterin phosphate synthase